MAYAGESITIPLGQAGLITDLPPTQIPPNALIRANNISFDKGLLEKAPGSLRYNDTALDSGANIVALADWWPDTVKQRLIAVTDTGKIFRDIGDREFSGGTAIATGLGNLTPNCQFVAGGNETASRNRKLFLFTFGQSQIQVLDGDGTAFADISTPAADWTTPNFPKTGTIHRNRLWAFMGQRSYASNTGDHENFTSSFLTDSVFPGEGGDIRGCFVFKGRLFCFKDGGYVYYLEDSDADSSNWFWRKLASNFGLSSVNGIAEVLNDMIAGNTTGGLASYAATEKLGDVESADLLRLAEIDEYYRANYSFAGVPEQHVLYYPAKKQFFLTTRTKYGPTNDALMVIDFNKESPRFSFWEKDSAQCLALRKDQNGIERPIYGGTDGFVYKMDMEDRLVNTSAYTGEFKTAHTDFRFAEPSLAGKKKHFDFLTLEFVPQGQWNATVDVYIDGKFIETLTFEQKIRTDGLGSFTLGSDPLGREETQSIRRQLHGTGNSISLHLKQSGSNQNFQAVSFTVDFRVSGKQAIRL